MYRPTVRYDDLYKEYVDQVFKATRLDRNQIIRLALFAAPFSPLFQHQLKKHMTSSPPPPLWEVTDQGLWMDRSFVKKEEGRDVNGYKKEIPTFKDPQSTSTPRETNGKTSRSHGEVCANRLLKQHGGITIKIG